MGSRKKMTDSQEETVNKSRCRNNPDTGIRRSGCQNNYDWCVKGNSGKDGQNG